jgi:hypothetical protein
MNCEARTLRDHETAKQVPNRVSLRDVSRGPGRGWSLSARPRPHAEGGRALIIKARSASQTIEMVLSAGEAAELMFEIGFNLEQAARASRGAGSIDGPVVAAIEIAR